MALLHVLALVTIVKPTNLRMQYKFKKLVDHYFSIENFFSNGSKVLDWLDCQNKSSYSRA